MKDIILEVLDKYQGVEYDETLKFALVCELEAEINAFLSREQVELMEDAVRGEPTSPQGNPPLYHADEKSS